MPHVPERFQIVRRLGAGGFGIVYEALDRARGERVALKTLARVSAPALYRFKREFRALADIAHDNLVRLHDLIGSGDEWLFTMELIHGVDWLTYVRGQGAAGGAAPTTAPAPETHLPSTAPPDEGIDLDATQEEAVVRWPASPTSIDVGADHRPEARADVARVRSSLVQVARALLAVHEARLVHRDLKPSNVLVTPEGRAVVLDFGIASRLSHSGQSATDAEQLVGTPRYMAPEQVSARAVAPSADWYALGVMLFEALAGEPPFAGTPLEILAEKQRAAPRRLQDVAPWAPDDLASLADDLLCTAPERRPSGPEVIRRLGGAGSPAAPAPAQGGRGARAARPPPGPELDALAGALARARGGQPCLVLVHGAAGAEPGARVRAFLDGWAEDALVLEGRCHEREQVPFKALDGAIDALSRHLVRAPPEQAAALMPRGAAALARVFPVLARVPAVRASPRSPADDEGEPRLRARASAALRDLLGRLSDRRPVIVFIADAHWGDADSAALLAEIMAPPDPAALLLIVAHRAEGDDRQERGPLLAALRASPAMAAVHTVEIDLS
ncbi:protein kinase [Sorangium sp. So ce296]|uniref:serine/threonine-protein kinase n=1 Tax=Sorangium sp. So ce296 TaxID=3133296 RepID=UPI003F5D8BEE